MTATMNPVIYHQRRRDAMTGARHPERLRDRRPPSATFAYQLSAAGIAANFGLGTLLGGLSEGLAAGGTVAAIHGCIFVAWRLADRAMVCRQADVLRKTARLLRQAKLASDEASAERDQLVRELEHAAVQLYNSSVMVCHFPMLDRICRLGPAEDRQYGFVRQAADLLAASTPTFTER